MSFIRKIPINDAPTYYTEDIEHIVIYPQTKKVTVQLTRQYFDATDKAVKSEAGGQEVFTHDFSLLIDKVREEIKKRRA